MRTSTVSVLGTRPSPWQVGQAFRSRPVPPQRGQVRLNRIAPAICVTLPDAVALRAGRRARRPPIPIPPQVGADLQARDVQLHLRAADRLPEIDIERVLEVGCPFPASSAPARVRRRPKNWLKRSRKPPADSGPARPAPAPPPRGSARLVRRNPRNRTRRSPCPGPCRAPAPARLRARAPNRSRTGRTSASSSDRSGRRRLPGRS